MPDKESNAPERSGRSLFTRRGLPAAIAAGAALLSISTFVFYGRYCAKVASWRDFSLSGFLVPHAARHGNVRIHGRLFRGLKGAPPYFVRVEESDFAAMVQEVDSETNLVLVDLTNGDARSVRLPFPGWGSGIGAADYPDSASLSDNETLVLRTGGVHGSEEMSVGLRNLRPIARGAPPVR